ncbi:MAG TPA: long-chain fatty acid--CoA ligase [Myxococcales bacterium]|nr:long-chain fatty acid--CoA ligase [Myxococcales bacterium]
MRGTMMDLPLTVSMLAERAARYFPDVEVVSRQPDRALHRTTWGSIIQRAKSLAGALLRAGLRRGDRVATLMWNHAPHLETYFGAPLAGGVVHTLNLRLSADDLAFIATHAQDRFLVVDDVLLPLLDKFRARAPFEQIIVVRHTPRELPAGCAEYESFLRSAGGCFEAPELDENEACGVCYTSGTTARPKGVVYTHRSTVLHTLFIPMTDGIGLRQADTVLPVVPMFHVNAWGLPYACAVAGAKLVFPGPHLDAESLLDLLERERITLGAGVPTIWMGILEALEKQPDRWKLQPGLRMVVGGSAAPEALIRGFDKHGLNLVHAWGMTEMSPLGSVSWLKAKMKGLPYDEQVRIRGKQGLPAALVQVRAVDDSGREAPWDGKTQGELQVRGPWVASAYTDMEGCQDRWTKDGWFKTGDVVTIDSEGYLNLTDRTKDLIKSGGEWISSVAVENALMGHPAVKEAAVIAVAHPKWQERPLAAVVLRDGMRVSADELRGYLAGRVHSYWVPDAFEFVDAIPRTSTGKFLKSALRERYRGYQFPK